MGIMGIITKRKEKKRLLEELETADFGKALEIFTSSKNPKVEAKAAMVMIRKAGTEEQRISACSAGKKFESVKKTSGWKMRFEEIESEYYKNSIMAQN